MSRSGIIASVVDVQSIGGLPFECKSFNFNVLRITKLPGCRFAPNNNAIGRVG